MHSLPQLPLLLSGLGRVRAAFVCLMAAVVLGGLWAGSCRAEQSATPLVVVELFTSQGCSSCPSADAYLADLAQRPGVLALSLHVNYWDYIGWPDPFASPLFTDRQRHYARQLGKSMVYTPQMVLNGRLEAAGNKRRRVERLIRRLQSGKESLTVPMVLEADSEGQLVVRLGPVAEPSLAGALLMMRFDHETVTQVEQGENRGRRLRNVHVVRSLEKLGTWSGEGNQDSASRRRLPLRGQDLATADQGLALLLQSPGGPVLGAAQWKTEEGGEGKMP